MLMRTANPGVLFQFLFVRVGSEKMRLNSAHTHTLYPVERIRLCKAADRLLLPSCSSSSPLHAMLVACMEEKKNKMAVGLSFNQNRWGVQHRDTAPALSID